MMTIESITTLAASYEALEKGIYTDTLNQQWILRGNDRNVQFLPMANTTEEVLRGIYVLEWKGELAKFLAADAAPYIPPTQAERNHQLVNDLLNLELFLGKRNVYHIANDHHGGSSMAGRLLGLY